MSLPAKVYFPVNMISTPVRLFNTCISSWNNLSLSTQNIWDIYASSNPIRDLSGNLRYLSGFDLYLQSNIQLIDLGLLLEPPALVVPGAVVVPDYSIVAFSNSLHIDFIPTGSFPIVPVSVYATAPFSGSGSVYRKHLFYIGSYDIPTSGIVDITADYISSLFIQWGSFFDSHSFSIKFFVCTVDPVSGLASGFKELLFSVSNSPGVNFNSYASEIELRSSGFAGFDCFNASSNANVIIASGQNTVRDLYWSSNGGSSFITLGNLGSSASKTGTFLNSDGIGLLGIAGTAVILRSTDNGYSWTSTGAHTPGNSFNFFVQGLSGKIIAAGQLVGRIYYSLDAGLTWSSYLLDGTSFVMRLLTYLENGIMLVYDHTRKRIYRSLDNGSSFSLVYSLPSTVVLYRISYCGNGVCVAFSGPNGDIYRSVDYGTSWSVVNVSTLASTLSEGYYIGGGLLVAFSYPVQDIIHSLDYGVTWSFVKNSGLATFVNRCVGANGRGLVALPGGSEFYLYHI
jgi:photosystem II stability/assembly factor-like uncharacterized protein